MRRHRESLWTNCAAGIGISSLAGAAVTGAVTVISAVLIYFILGDIRLVKWFTAAALIMGGYSGGYICGRYRRHRGITEGAVCGICIYALLLAAGLVLTGSAPGIKKLLLLTVSGAAGGAFGVNSKRPSKLMD